VVEFDADGPRVPASFDRRLLGRAVRNLIENAVRASASGGRVEIAVEAGADEDVVRVADDGPGVPAEMVARVVEPYFSTQSGGTGLGLPIARRIAEEHGGSLALRNRPSGGFEVTITIPRG
ncbi:MAG: ATP-binding protein, partial [Thermoanaerobaculia bacterium]|nr:ATP-binding protein [Thermoanaerobaculia bacterium]